MRLIDADKLENDIAENITVKAVSRMLAIIQGQPTLKAIPSELYEQIKGERDVAIEQLKALNIELFEKPYLKAIPIEWIKKWLETCIPRYDYDRMTYIADVYEMLEDWEEENEKSGNSD